MVPVARTRRHHSLALDAGLSYLLVAVVKSLHPIHRCGASQRAATPCIGAGQYSLFVQALFGSQNRAPTCSPALASMPLEVCHVHPDQYPL